MSAEFYKKQIDLRWEENKNTDSTPSNASSRSFADPYRPGRAGQETKGPKFRGSARQRLSLFFIILIIAFSIIGSMVASDNNNFLSGVKNSYLVRQIVNIINPAEKYLAGEKADRINFLLLGMGGPGHNGPLLTDTIIVASLEPSTKKAAIFSLPRDMIVPLTSQDYRKINSIYALGEQSGENQGGELAKEVVGRTLDIPIHYYVAVDFKGFVELVDAIGGLDIEVERAFTDSQFPTEDYKYQEVSFPAGRQNMDGLTALRFARSRHGNNGEGSDFARIKRQQKIITTAKDKITSFNTWINPKKITSLFNLFNQYTKTDLEPWEAVKLVHMAKSLDTQKITSQSIDDSPGSYLRSGITLDGAFILQPISGTFAQIQMLVRNIFDIEELKEEKAKIVIQNGTASAGLALKAVNHLNQVGYQVIRYGNADSTDKLTTVIYNYNGDKPRTKASLEAIFQTSAQNQVPLEYSSPVISSAWDIRDEKGELIDLDFLIILGQDQNLEAGAELVKTIDPSLLNTSTATTTDVLDSLNQ